MTSWRKIPEDWQKKARVRAEFWLEYRLNARAEPIYRVNERARGIQVRKVISGRFRTWVEAQDEGRKLLPADSQSAKVLEHSSLVRTEKVADEIVAFKKKKDPSTFEQCEIFFRVHLKPFLRGECAYSDRAKGEVCPHRDLLDAGTCHYASQLNTTQWLAYKTHFRMHRPDSPLFNHWKYFGQLMKLSFEKGLISRKPKLDYDEETEDDREEGKQIPAHHFRRMIEVAKEVSLSWHDRLILGRTLGLRPSVIRELRKDQYDSETGYITLLKKMSKNRKKTYAIQAPEIARKVLNARLASPSAFFFPARGKADRPMDKSLKVWSEIIRLCSFDATYTPHDLRHTRLDELFKSSNNHILICHQHDISVEEATKTYVKPRVEDTVEIAEDADRRLRLILGVA